MRGISYRKLLLATHIVSILLVAGIYAQPTRETAPKVGRVELKQPSEFDVWVDSFVAESGSGQDTPLAIVIVKNDRVLFSKGYGFLDSQQKYPVDPERTIFRAASISKLFTTVAVMKLVEQGKLDLDADLNRYLQGFQIESKSSKPITVAHLLTHTSGLEERVFGNVVPIGKSPSLKEVFTRRVPRQIRSAGEEIVYSNLGMALAGYIVEVVSGTTFEEFVEQEILNPLNMTHSSFRQPYPAHLAGTVVPSGADDVALLHYPAGSLISSASDMGKFIVMLMNGRPILREETLREMQQRHFTQVPEMPGIAYGLFEHFQNGRRILFHTGASGHQSLLCVLPEERIGFYLVLSASQGGELGGLRKQFLREFLNRYFPSNEEGPLTISHDNQTTIPGLYRPQLLSPLTIEALGNLALDTKVNENKDGSIDISFPPFGTSRIHFQKFAPNVFRSDEGIYVAFKGSKMFISGGLSDPLPFHRIRWYESGRVHLILFVSGAVFYGFVCLISLFFLIRKLFPKSKQTPLREHAKSLAVSASWLYILAPLFAISYYMLGDPEQRPFKVTAALMVGSSILNLAVLVGLSTSILIVYRFPHLSKRERLWLLPFAAIGLSSIPFFYYWNLLGFKF